MHKHWQANYRVSGRPLGELSWEVSLVGIFIITERFYVSGSLGRMGRSVYCISRAIDDIIH